MAFRMMQSFFKDKRSDEIDYQEYIRSGEWKEKAEAAKEAAGYRCQLCNASGFASTLHAHHNTYERLGNEWQSDITVLCDKCHKIFHENGGSPGRKTRLTREDFLGVLKREGVTFTNDDPYTYYDKGKVIIQHIINGVDHELYDYYNKFNIEVLNAAIDNQGRRFYREAQENDFEGYEDEYSWREIHEHWEGWKR